MDAQDGVQHRQISVPGTDFFICNQQPSFTQVLRAVKRQEHGIFNCLASVLHDTQFVEEVADLFPGLPLLANLRCGLWYSPTPAATCYFKSTDGHWGQWNFSTTRINLHVACEAASKGGVIIVDATRRGKTFPDALTKTIPIWAAVINRAVALLRLQSSPNATEAAESEPSDSHWDAEVHLPPWIAANEQNHIRQRLPGCVEALLGVGADLAQLVDTLHKPLRCLWVSQDSTLWEGEAPAPASLPFTPVILVSASLPNARTRRRLLLPELDRRLEVMYDYIPGAGDDEESWARGLTPGVFWAHYEALLRAGPEGVAPLVQRLVKQQQRQQRGHVQQQHVQSTTHASAVETSHSQLDICWIGDTRLGLSSARLAGSGDIWHHADAVLDVSPALAPPMDGEPGTAVDVTASGALVISGECGRFVSLPVMSHKEDRRALLHRLPAAVQFASCHLAAGRRLVVTSAAESGGAAACVVLGCLLACFALGEDAGGRPALTWRQPATVDAVTATVHPPDAAAFNRLTVRQYLAALSAHVPQAVLPQGMLKQVYNAFLPDRMAAPPPGS